MSRPRSLARRVGRIAVRGLAVVLIGVLSLVLLVLICMDLPPARKFIAAQANSALSEAFQGRVTIRHIGHIGLNGVAGVDAVVDDAQGKRVLDLHGASVDLFWPGLVWNLIAGGPDLEIDIDGVRCRHIEAVLRDDGKGQPTIASAFLPKKPSTEPEQPGETIVRVDGIELGHAWIHGGLPALQVIDAEINGLKASLALEPRTTRFEAAIDRLRGRGLPLAVDPSGRLTAKGDLPSDPKAPQRAEARWDGLIAGARTNASARLDGKRVEAEVIAREIAANTLARLAPGLAPRDATTLEARVNGTLPELRFHARVENSALRLRADGTAKLEDTTVVHAALKASEIDLSGLVADAPRTNLELSADADARLANDGSVDAKYALAAMPGQAAGYATPEIELSGSLTRRGDGTLASQGSVNIEEPGAPTKINYDLGSSASQGTVIEIRSNTALEEPPRLEALANGLKLAGGLEIEARFEPEKNLLDARANARLRRLAQAENRIASLGLAAHVSGSPDAPRLSTSLTATGVAVGGRSFTRVKLDAQGTPERLNVSAELDGKNPDQIRLRTALTLGPSIVAERPSVTLADAEGRVELGARSVRVANGAIRVDTLDLRGAGSLSASLVYTQRLDKLQMESRDLDIARLLRLVGADAPLKAGLASITAQYDAGPRGPSGAIKARAHGLRIDSIENGAVDLDLAVADRKITGTLDAALGKALRAQATLTDVTLLEPPFTRQKLDKLTGAILVKGDGDLAQLSAMLRRSGAPVESGKGRVVLDVDVRRQNVETQPIVNAKLRTYQLELLGRRDTEKPIESAAEARAAEPWHLAEVDFAVEATLDQNQKIASLLAKASDRRGPLLSVDASAPLSVPLVEVPALIRSLSTTPFQVRVEMPERRMQRLPKMIRPRGVRGLLALDVRAQGTLRNPELKALVTMQRLRSGDRTHEIDVRATAEYEHLKGKIAIDASTAKRQVARIGAEFIGNPLHLAEADALAEKSPVLADFSAKFDQFPLGAIPMLYDRQIRGPLSADIVLEDIGQNARLRTTIHGDGIVLGRVAVQELRGLIETQANKLRGSMRIGGNGGFMHADFVTNVAWGNRTVPVIDPNPEAKLTARRFRIETFLPLVQGQVSELAGRLTADVTAQIQNGVPRVDGTAALDKGVVHLPAVGQRFEDIQARVSIHEGQVRLDRFEAHGISGKVTATAGAQLVGTELRSAQAQVRIKQSEKLPVTMEGVSLGDAWGRVNVRYTAQKTQNHLLVDVPDFHIQMADDSGGSVQALDPAEGVRIGTRRKDRDFVTLPVQPLEEEAPGGAPGKVTPTIVEVKLGRSVVLERGKQVKVQLTGGVRVESGAGEPNITGRIELRGGTLDVQGKTFEIESGVVTFTGGDPSNPTITATARWDSPADYVIYAEYSGTAQEGKLELRAEPPLAQNEILSLIMFGSPDGTFGSGEGSNAETAVGLAGGTAAQGLNRIISDFTSLDVSARVDTSTGSARPEIVMQLSPRLTARVTRAIGEPPPGESPDRTFLTLDLRLQRAWSLSTMLGDRGASALDLIWRKRY